MNIKVGFICLHDENSTYDLNFINGAKAACEELGISEDNYIIKTNIPEGQECFDAAEELVDAGCGIIFADSFGHEDYMIQAAKEFKDVQFCHATGTYLFYLAGNAGIYGRANEAPLHFALSATSAASFSLLTRFLTAWQEQVSGSLWITGTLLLTSPLSVRDLVTASP